MNWQTRNLGELVDFRNGVNFSREQEGVGIPILKVKDFGALHHVPLGELDELDPARIKVSAHQFLEPKDIVIIRSNGNRELVGRSMIYNGEPKKVTFSGFCIRARALDDEAVPEFIHYWLRSPLTRATFAREGNGTGINNLSQGFLSSQSIQLPDLDEQSRIVRVLGALDDKIELNRRMNETLEEMARALFRDWFVDFGPTRRQMAMKEQGLATDPAAIMGHAFPAGDMPEKVGTGFSPGIATTKTDRPADVGTGSAPENDHGVSTTNPLTAAALAPLFPAKLGDDGLPEGWRRCTLSDICKITSGKRPPLKVDKPTPENPVPVWGGNGIGWYTNQTLFDTRLIVTGRVGTLGTVYRVPEAVWVSDNALCVFPKGRKYEFVFQSMRTFDYKSLNSGSTQPLITQTALKKQTCNEPGQDILDQFEEVTDSFTQKMRTNEQENQTLAALRDLLLPKLMSGEIRLIDAEALV